MARVPPKYNNNRFVTVGLCKNISEYRFDRCSRETVLKRLADSIVSLIGQKVHHFETFASGGQAKICHSGSILVPRETCLATGRFSLMSRTLTITIIVY